MKYLLAYESGTECSETTYSPVKMEQTNCSQALAFKLQTPINHPEKAYDIQNMAKF
jgi:hypothetical protein